ncbi:CSS-motif domain-containing protein [Enterobacter hormaechei]|nr:CSS-motif domain-containing protein [Enterobacter hormaechei]
MKLIAPLVVLGLAGVLALTVLLMQRQAQQDTDLALAVATRSITDILSEAERVMTMNRAFLGQGCPPQLVRQMARSVALSPHLRDVRLLQNNVTVCASLGGAPDLPSLPDAVREGPVTLLTRGDVLTPSEPVLILAQQYPEGGVAVSLNGLFLLQVLRETADRPGLVFRAGGMEVDVSGVVRRSWVTEGSPASGRYDFSLATDPHHPLRGRSLLWEALPWLLLSLLAASGVTALLHWWVHRQVSKDVQLRRAMAPGSPVMAAVVILSQNDNLYILAGVWCLNEMPAPQINANMVNIPALHGEKHHIARLQILKLDRMCLRHAVHAFSGSREPGIEVFAPGVVNQPTAVKTGFRRYSSPAVGLPQLSHQCIDDPGPRRFNGRMGHWSGRNTGLRFFVYRLMWPGVADR